MRHAVPRPDDIFYAGANRTATSRLVTATLWQGKSQWPVKRIMYTAIMMSLITHGTQNTSCKPAFRRRLSHNPMRVLPSGTDYTCSHLKRPSLNLHAISVLARKLALTSNFVYIKKIPSFSISFVPSNWYGLDGVCAEFTLSYS